nr:24-hydroxycholesterol 7-alpha-hydroxylase-like isoform X1 [Pocillopora verrucosa]
MAAFAELLKLSSFIIFAALLVISLLTLNLLRTKNVKYPPIIKGWIPWLGCAIEFGKAPLTFIKESSEKHGEVFTFYAIGQRMTFLTDVRDFHLFFNSPQADFQRAVEDAVKNTAGINRVDFFANHRKIHDLVKGRLSSSNLSKLTPKVGRKLEEYATSAKITGSEVDLMTLARDIVFSAVVPVLFGEGILPQTHQEFKHFQKQFDQFDSNFEHGAKLPDFLLKEWAKSKYFLLDVFGKALQKKTYANVEDTLLQAMVESLEGDCAPNYATLLLWASLANAVPITFWTLAFVLSDQGIKKDLQQEVDLVLGPYIDSGSLAKLSLEEVKKLRKVEHCILEAIRLRPAGMIARKLTGPMQVREFTIPAGDMLMISPYWAHQNEAIYPDARSYVPERWNQTVGSDKSAPSDKFFAFGGGRFQCPGRRFAMMEIQMFISLLLCSFDLELVKEEVPLPSPQHVVGVPHPLSPCYVKMHKRVRTV